MHGIYFLKTFYTMTTTTYMGHVNKCRPNDHEVKN